MTKNKNVEEKKKNMTDEESNVISMSEGKDSNDDKKKKKKKNKQKKGRKEENIKYSSDKSIINVTKGMKDNFKEDDDSTLDTSNNVMLERTNNHPKVERSFRLQNNKNKFVHINILLGSSVSIQKILEEVLKDYNEKNYNFILTDKNEYVITCKKFKVNHLYFIPKLKALVHVNHLKRIKI
ncbi:hypothetical protein PFNF135_01286 [Plasmodium falciparum NF135/5.C10]|uniref:Uncharacterized protein n=1 Tax=Plasmodium falciparum NF135/5.C10 TaxID=1036726 RepID=W4IMI8_PLAFA|nr:hypothetical protein PFNF135_01286 [Plasmodium falciparum NF135/5.C10]